MSENLFYGFETGWEEDRYERVGGSSGEQEHDRMVDEAICKYEEWLVVLIACCILMQIMIMTTSFIELAMLPIALLETKTVFWSVLGLMNLYESGESELERKQYIKELLVTTWDLIFLVLICCYRLADFYYFSLTATPLFLSLAFAYCLRNPSKSKWKILNEKVSHK